MLFSCCASTVGVRFPLLHFPPAPLSVVRSLERGWGGLEITHNKKQDPLILLHIPWSSSHLFTFFWEADVGGGVMPLI